MPGLSGIEVTRLAARCSPETSVILFSGYGSRAQVVEALDAGARGFLLKNLSLAEVLRAVQVVSRGGTYVDSTLAVALNAPEDAPTLTHRDRDVLRLLASGERYEEIGRPLRLDRDRPQDHVQGQDELGAETATGGRRRRAMRHSLISVTGSEGLEKWTRASRPISAVSPPAVARPSASAPSSRRSTAQAATRS